jgi:hypothetical protein
MAARNGLILRNVTRFRGRRGCGLAWSAISAASSAQMLCLTGGRCSRAEMGRYGLWRFAERLPILIMRPRPRPLADVDCGCTSGKRPRAGNARKIFAVMPSSPFPRALITKPVGGRIAARRKRLDNYPGYGTPPPGAACELLCEDHVGTYALPFLCQWSDGTWRNIKTGEPVLGGVVAWRKAHYRA